MSEKRPVVSFITPVYNTEASVLEACIESVKQQTCPRWELCICDDASSSQETQDVLSRYKELDSRIKIIRSEKNLHISGASNKATELARGEFLSFLDHDDTLSSDAVLEILKATEADATVDLLYADEDKIDFSGQYTDEYRKPDWSPEHLLSVMYVLHPLTIRRSLFLQLGGLRDEYSGAQDYDLALRASRLARNIAHIPKILYHWRMVAGSASAEVAAKPYALQAGLRALQDHVQTIDAQARVEAGQLEGLFRVRWSFDQKTPVTLAFLTHGTERTLEDGRRVVLIENALQSIRAKSTYAHYRFLVVDDGNLSQELRLRLQALGATLVTYTLNGAFNYSDKINFTLKSIETEHFFLLNDDIEVITPDWIESLLEWTIRPEIGIAGPRLLFPNQTIQHAGLMLHKDLGATHVFYNRPASQPGYQGYTHLVKNVAVVTGAVMATKRSVIERIGGYDTRLAVDFNDVDFCLRAFAEGYRIVYTPHAELVHHERSSLIRETQNADEVALFKARWSELLKRDPYFSDPECRS